MKDERYDYHHNAITDMMERKPNILLEKSEAFAGRIVKMYQYLTTKRNEHTLSKQILRSGQASVPTLQKQRMPKVFAIISTNKTLR